MCVWGGRNEATVLQVEETVQRLRERKAEKQSALQSFQQYQVGSRQPDA